MGIDTWNKWRLVSRETGNRDILNGGRGGCPKTYLDSGLFTCRTPSGDQMCLTARAAVVRTQEEVSSGLDYSILGWSP